MGLYCHPPKKSERSGLGRNPGESLGLLLLLFAAVPENGHILLFHHLWAYASVCLLVPLSVCWYPTERLHRAP